MSQEFVSIDQAARDQIKNSLDDTLFVEAGAGTGKTTCLVDRVLGLVSAGRATVDRIAVITFTDSSAAELRDRIREALEKAALEVRADGIERDRCRQGVRDIDQASIQTIHSFATDLLQSKPLEAGLPPGFRVMDRVEADLSFEDHWQQWLDAALDDPETGQTFALAISLGMSISQMRGIALDFHHEYDQLDGVVFASLTDAQGKSIPALVQAAPVLDQLCQYARLGECDRLVRHVRSVLSWIRRLREIEPSSPQAYQLLKQAGQIRFSKGRQSDWDLDPETGVNACALLKDRLGDLNEVVRADLAEARRVALGALLTALKGFSLEYAVERKSQGTPQFHDLLVWTRDLIRDDRAVRDHFRNRFLYLLIDEVQDVDPIQAEIALLLSQTSDSWTWCNQDKDGPQVASGRMFAVGDPKQSIYRFRRADINQVRRLQTAMGSSPVRLLQNYRTQKPIIDWVNHLFLTRMTGTPEQAEYMPLSARWQPMTKGPTSPGAWYIGTTTSDRTVGQMREKEAAAITRLLSGFASGDWQVMDREATERAGDEQYRPARLSDVCILMPHRTALRTLELALEEGDVPYRLEGASLIFNTQEVRDLLNCLRVIDDPSDQISLVATLRSPAFACSDEELLNFVRRDGRFDYLELSGPEDGPVADGLRSIREYHHERPHWSTAMLIERVIRDRRLIEAAMSHPRPREVWRRYQFLVDQARAFVQAGGGSLRSFLEWTDRQISEGTRVTEVPAPESDEDSVRVMTVHAAKGLEFAIVVLVGLNADRGKLNIGPVIVDRQSGAIEVGVGSDDDAFRTVGFEAMLAREKELEEQEFIRLLYVACTRARDHLVVSMFRTASDKTSAAALIAETMEGNDHLWRPAPYFDLPTVSVSPLIPEAFGDPTMLERERWQAKRETLLSDRSQPATVAATTLAHLDKNETVSNEPWRRGRGGTSLGRAVHAVLQTIDLATGEGLDETAAAQATAEGIGDRTGEVASLAQVALGSPVVRRAVASGKIWREVPVAAPLGRGAVEGFVDLMFQNNGGLVVVDYKTDALDVSETSDAVHRYRLQAGTYALALMQVTGLAVNEVVLLFLQPQREEVFRNIDEIIDEARTAALEHVGEADG